MKASELIEKIQLEIQRVGDLRVVTRNNFLGEGEPTVDVVRSPGYPQTGDASNWFA